MDLYRAESSLFVRCRTYRRVFAAYLPSKGRPRRVLLPVSANGVGARQWLGHDAKSGMWHANLSREAFDEDIDDDNVVRRLTRAPLRPLRLPFGNVPSVPRGTTNSPPAKSPLVFASSWTKSPSCRCVLVIVTEVGIVQASSTVVPFTKAARTGLGEWDMVGSCTSRRFQHEPAARR